MTQRNELLLQRLTESINTARLSNAVDLHTMLEQDCKEEIMRQNINTLSTSAEIERLYRWINNEVIGRKVLITPTN